MTHPAHRPPRFPWGPAVLCAACVGAAGWTWMRYSYASDVTPADLYDLARGDPEGEYVSVTGRLARLYLMDEDLKCAKIYDTEDEDVGVTCFIPAGSPDHPVGDIVTVRGRVTTLTADMTPPVLVDAGASRFHPATVPGLLVGAVGASLFALYLHVWLRDRRAAPPREESAS